MDQALWLSSLTLMLLVASLPIQNDAKNLKKLNETLAHGTNLRVLRKGYPMNNNMTGFKSFSKIFASLCLVQK